MQKLRFTIALWMFVYPLVTFLVWGMKHILPKGPLLLFTLILTLIIVPFISYIIVPFVGRITTKTQSNKENA